MLIEELDPSVRLYNCLKRTGINTVEQLSQMTDDDLMKIRCFGAGCLAEVRAKIAAPRNTNADRIRAMSDKELAWFLAERYAKESVLRLRDSGCEPTATEIKAVTERLYLTWMRWLQTPAEEAEHG